MTTIETSSISSASGDLYGSLLNNFAIQRQFAEFGEYFFNVISLDLGGISPVRLHSRRTRSPFDFPSLFPPPRFGAREKDASLSGRFMNGSSEILGDWSELCWPHIIETSAYLNNFCKIWLVALVHMLLRLLCVMYTYFYFNFKKTYENIMNCQKILGFWK